MSRDDILRLERLVAHRELQLARASSRPGGGYLVARRRKLDAARAALDRARVRAATAEVATLCGCGQTFIAVTPNDERCSACRAEDAA